MLEGGGGEGLCGRATKKTQFLGDFPKNDTYLCWYCYLLLLV